MKFSGFVGFWNGDKEIKPGIYKPDILEKPYTGNVLRNSRTFQSVSDQQNDNLVLSNSISIISDMYLKNNWSSIRYVIWNGAKLKVTSVELNHPRVTLTVGGVYNGKEISS